MEKGNSALADSFGDQKVQSLFGHASPCPPNRGLMLVSGTRLGQEQDITVSSFKHFLPRICHPCSEMILNLVGSVMGQDWQNPGALPFSNFPGENSPEE